MGAIQRADWWVMSRCKWDLSIQEALQRVSGQPHQRPLHWPGTALQRQRAAASLPEVPSRGAAGGERGRQDVLFSTTESESVQLTRKSVVGFIVVALPEWHNFVFFSQILMDSVPLGDKVPRKKWRNIVTRTQAHKHTHCFVSVGFKALVYFLWK